VAFARVAVAEALQSSTEETNRLEMEFSFESQVDGEGREVCLLLEPASGLEARLNGETLTLTADEALTLPGYRMADAAGALKVGTNTLAISMEAGALRDGVAPIERPVLSGDFAVALDDKGELTLEHEPDLLQNGDWTLQGYPFFAGVMRLRQTFQYKREGHKRTFLHIPQSPFAAGVRVSVGEHDFADITYAPHRLEVTRLASEGENTAVVEVTAGRYNLFGPVHLHHRLTSPVPARVRDFDVTAYRERKLWNRRPQLMPFGLPTGLAVEVYDPSAPPPSKKQKSSSDEAESRESSSQEN
jgi:hypothetical protein